MQAWLESQTGRLLPCHYFLITFTVPQEVRAAMLAYPAEGYAALLGAAADSLKTAATNPRHVGAREVGLLGVLHTWGRDLTYHPHAHFIVAAPERPSKAGGARVRFPSRILPRPRTTPPEDRPSGTGPPAASA